MTEENQEPQAMPDTAPSEVVSNEGAALTRLKKKNSELQAELTKTQASLEQANSAVEFLKKQTSDFEKLISSRDEDITLLHKVGTSLKTEVQKLRDLVKFYLERA